MPTKKKLRKITNTGAVVMRENLRGGGYALHLAKRLGCRIVTPTDTPKVTPEDNVTVINYGRSAVPAWFRPDRGHQFLNDPRAIPNSVDKMRCFDLLRKAGIHTLETTNDRAVAAEWLAKGVVKVFVRTTMTGTRGEGITVYRDPNELPATGLYIRGFPTAHEFRVHVMHGKIIDLTQKRRRRGVEASNDIRNLDNGWVFTRENTDDTQKLRDTAIKAVEACGLDFAGVDMLMSKRGKVAVCELNTAPAMQNTTLDRYVSAIEELL